MAETERARSDRATPCTMTVTPEGRDGGTLTLEGHAVSCTVNAGDFPCMAKVTVTLYTADVDAAIAFAQDGDFVDMTLQQHSSRRTGATGTVGVRG